MAVQQKGKQATKGAKQIVEENVATLKFYRNMSLGASAFFLIVQLCFFDLFSGLVITMTILTFAAHFAAYQFMVFMCRPQLSETGSILDSGTDLNMEGGLAEHVKDLVILTSGTQLLALISNYFWYLWLLAPIRAGWLLWGSVIKPWMQQRNEKPEVDEKKQKKMDRKMRRMR